MLKNQLTKLPVWVKFSNTTVPNQTPHGLSYIASVVGILCTRTLTASKTRLAKLHFVEGYTSNPLQRFYGKKKPSPL